MESSCLSISRPLCTWLDIYTRRDQSPANRLCSLSAHTLTTSLYSETSGPNFPQTTHTAEVKDFTITPWSQSHPTFWADPQRSMLTSRTTIYTSPVFSESSQVIEIGQ